MLSNILSDIVSVSVLVRMLAIIVEEHLDFS